MRVGRSFHVDSSHVLPGHPKCGVMHGHTYRFDIVVEGPDEAEMVVDFDEIKSAGNDVLDQLDHVHLNDIMPMPTVENLARLVHARLIESLPGLALVRVWEGDGKYTEFEPARAR
jgi:6-pyruvoyltetrahydropterin/6-carboxytetrahydropterin synthase